MNLWQSPHRSADSFPRRKSGFFSDDPLAEWACIVVLAVACFALVLFIPGGQP